MTEQLRRLALQFSSRIPPLLRQPAVAWCLLTFAFAIVPAVVHDGLYKSILYYYDNIHSADGFAEYPYFSTVPARLIDILSTQESYRFIFVAVHYLLISILAYFFFKISRATGWWWLAFCLFMGGLMLSRLDLFPALLVMLAVALLFHSPNVSAVVLGFATLVKYWPGFLAVGLVGGWRKPSTFVRVLLFILGLAATGAASIALIGFTQTISPLTYQTGRGLQIESIAATPFVLLSFITSPHTYYIFHALSDSFEITGPGVAVAAKLTDLSMLLAVGFGILLACYPFVKNRWTPKSGAAAFMVMGMLVLITNKVFSPQYLIWFLPSLVFLQDKISSRYFHHFLKIYLITCAITCWIFPYLYGMFVFPNNSPLVYLCLLARNLLIIYLLILAILWWLDEQNTSVISIATRIRRMVSHQENTTLPTPKNLTRYATYTNRSSST